LKGFRGKRSGASIFLICIEEHTPALQADPEELLYLCRKDNRKYAKWRWIFMAPVFCAFGICWASTVCPGTVLDPGDASICRVDRVHPHMGLTC
jgi:hypothetical protein